MMIRKWSLLQMEAPQRIYSDLFASTLKVLLSTSRPYQAPSFGAGSSEKLLEISETNKWTESPSLSIKIFLWKTRASKDLQTDLFEQKQI